MVDELGGSALYCALAAAPECPVRVFAAVGEDTAPRVERLLRGRPGIDLSGIQRLPRPTYRWFAEAAEGRNVDLGSRDSIYDRWVPRLPDGYRGWAFLGSMRPDRQLDCARRLAGCGLLAADAMRSYVDSAPEAARAVLRLADWYFCNREELLALGGGEPEAFRAHWDLRGLVVKDGPGGATVFSDSGTLHVAAIAGKVVDTTGAGDALAGGMLARWVRSDGAPALLEDAFRHGVARATLTIADWGLRALLD